MHFYTEPSLLNPQTPATAYGPVQGHESDQFNVAATFTVSAEAKVFACQDSMMIVQPYVDVDTGTVNNGLVNIILKPLKGLRINFPSIKYYVYRGVDKNSLISGTAITPDDPTTKTEFITKFWKNWNDYKNNVNSSNTTDPTPKSFGFDPSLAKTTLLEEIFNSKESNNAAIKELQAIRVKEGEWIGNILTTNEFHFEIITDTDHLPLDLEYARKSKDLIDVNGMPETNAQEKFTLKAEREKILNYIDPAAFFGLHFDRGVRLSTYSGATKNTVLKKGADIYTEILAKFHTRNTVYLDIRSERGYSYTYYENYKDNNGDNLGLAIGSPYEGDIIYTLNYYKYQTENWPIYIIPDILGHETYEENAIHFTLRIDDNTKPVLHYQGEFFDTNYLLLGGTTEWITEITLESPNIPGVPGSSSFNIAYYFKLHYFRREDNAASPNMVLKVEKYLDAAFGGIHLPALSIANVFQHLSHTKRAFVQGSNFAYVAENGVYHDDSDLVLFYADNVFPLKSSGNVFPKINISKTEQNTIVDSPLLRKDTVYNKWKVNDGTNDIDILEIVGYNRTTQQTTPMEDLLSLGLTKTEWSLLDTVTGLSNLHHKYVAFEEIPNQKDVNTNTPYKKYKLKVQGLDDAGVQQVKTPSPDVFVYGSGLNMFCSGDFAASANLPNALPDPGVYTEWDHNGDFTYDKNDSDVQILYPSTPKGIVNVSDNGNNLGLSSIEVELKAEVFFPADKPNLKTPSSMPSMAFPLIVIIHGNGHHYHEYKELGKHLAQNGFIVAAINCLFDYKKFKLNNSISPINFAGINYDNYFNVDGVFLYSSGSKKVARYEQDSVTGSDTITPLSWTYATDFTVSSGKIRFSNKQKTQGMATLGRAELLYPHLKILKKKFSTKITNNIGLIGHSRGGEAVLRVAKDISGSSSPADLKNINAIISLAPTDIWDVENLTQHIPYFVLYGSMDGDVVGYRSKSPPNRTSGFSLWDRAKNNTEKSMTFVHGATHNGFITDNHDYAVFRFKDFKTQLLPPPTQKKITLSYINAFFRVHLKNETIWKSIFHGDYIPASVHTKNLLQQYKNMKPSHFESVKDFESGTNIGTSPGKVSLNPNTPAISSIEEGHVLDKDKQTPHDTKGLIVTWGASDVLTFHISSSGKDVSHLNYVSFRIGHVAQISPASSVTSFSETKTAYLFLNPMNPTTPTDINPNTPIAYNAAKDGSYSSLKDLKIRIVDISGNGGSFDQKTGKEVPAPHFRENRLNRNLTEIDEGTSTDYTDDEITYVTQNLTKSAMITVRISLTEFVNIGGVDLTKVKELSLIFPSIGSGKIVIDDVEFTN